MALSGLINMECTASQQELLSELTLNIYVIMKFSQSFYLLNKRLRLTISFSLQPTGGHCVITPFLFLLHSLLQLTPPPFFSSPQLRTSTYMHRINKHLTNPANHSFLSPVSFCDEPLLKKLTRACSEELKLGPLQG